ncbi:hypothetical protein TorRG33x02_327010, partial [Trema orientale]
MDRTRKCLYMYIYLHYSANGEMIVWREFLASISALKETKCSIFITQRSRIAAINFSRKNRKKQGKLGNKAMLFHFLSNLIFQIQKRYKGSISFLAILFFLIS